MERHPSQGCPLIFLGKEAFVRMFLAFLLDFHTWNENVQCGGRISTELPAPFSPALDIPTSLACSEITWHCFHERFEMMRAEYVK